ncbi:MAG: hypothetical protein JXQ96_22375 [Cyclobacteriaceae bacterium]
MSYNSIINVLKSVFLFAITALLTSSCGNKPRQSSDEQSPDKETETTLSWIDKDESEDYVARHECSFVQAGDKFIMFGGREQAKRLDIYDYKTNTWSTGAEAPKEFNHFQATAYKGFVWIIGSFKTNDFPREQPEDNIWLYHPPTNSWIEGPEIPEGRRRGGAGLVVYDDKFYVVGGNTIGHDGGFVNWFDEYDPRANTWTELENASQQRDHFSAAVIGDKLYAAAGRKSGGEGGVFSPLPAIVDVYDFQSNSWSTLSKNIPTPRAAPGVIVYNGELLLMGGEGENKGPAFKVVEAYNPATDSWSSKASMNYARHGTQAILSGKGIYIAAGSPTTGGGRQHNMEVYGEDSPEGEPLVTSTLEAMDQLSINAGSVGTITLNNTGGNTGSFITSLEIMGTQKDNFSIVGNDKFILVDPEVSKSINFQHYGSSAGDTVELKINYNGTYTLTITLISK